MKKIFMLACACLLIAACNSNKRVQTILLLLPIPKSPICIMQKTHWTTMGLTPEHSLLQIARVSTSPLR